MRAYRTRPAFALTLLVAGGFSYLSASAELNVEGYTVAAVASSSTLSGPQQRYAPWRTIDRDPRTAWCEGAKGDGVGEWLSLQLDKPIKADRIALQLGYHKDAGIFARNAVPTSLRIQVDDRTLTAKLAPTRRTHTVALPATPFRRLKITIAGVRRGSRHHDACISSVGLSFRGQKILLVSPAEATARAHLRRDLAAIQQAFGKCRKDQLKRHLKLPLRFTPLHNDPDGSTPAPALTLNHLRDVWFICRKGRNPFARGHEEIAPPSIDSLDDLTVQQLRFPRAELLDVAGQAWSLLWTAGRWIVTRIY